MSVVKVGIQTKGTRPDLIHSSSKAHVATSDAWPPDLTWSGYKSIAIQHECWRCAASRKRQLTPAAALRWVVVSCSAACIYHKWELQLMVGPLQSHRHSGLELWTCCSLYVDFDKAGVMLEPASLCESSHTHKCWRLPVICCRRPGGDHNCRHSSLVDTKRRPRGELFSSRSVRMSPAVTTTTQKLVLPIARSHGRVCDTHGHSAITSFKKTSNLCN
jgi:hypothetical protein